MEEDAHKRARTSDPTTSYSNALEQNDAHREVYKFLNTFVSPNVTKTFRIGPHNETEDIEDYLKWAKERVELFNNTISKFNSIKKSSTDQSVVSWVTSYLESQMAIGHYPPRQVTEDDLRAFHAYWDEQRSMTPSWRSLQSSHAFR